MSGWEGEGPFSNLLFYDLYLRLTGKEGKPQVAVLLEGVPPNGDPRHDEVTQVLCQTHQPGNSSRLVLKGVVLPSHRPWAFGSLGRVVLVGHGGQHLYLPQASGMSSVTPLLRPALGPFLPSCPQL